MIIIGLSPVYMALAVITFLLVIYVYAKNIIHEISGPAVQVIEGKKELEPAIAASAYQIKHAS